MFLQIVKCLIFSSSYALYMIKDVGQLFGCLAVCYLSSFHDCSIDTTRVLSVDHKYLFAEDRLSVFIFEINKRSFIKVIQHFFFMSSKKSSYCWVYQI